MPLHPCLIAPRTAKAARIAPSGCLPAMLLCGFVDARLVALAPGAGDLDTGFLGQRAHLCGQGHLVPRLTLRLEPKEISCRAGASILVS